MRYRVHSMRIRCKRWYPTKEAAIAAFERNCKRLGISPPRYYPPAASGDGFVDNAIAYPHYICAVGVRDGHGCVYIEASNDVEVR